MKWCFVRLVLISWVLMICSCATTTATISEGEAIRIARKQLVAARANLTVGGLVPGNNFVPAGPTSGGGPKWVIGFETKDKKTGARSVYYVTVFPDGKTGPHEIREGATERMYPDAMSR